jgi:hypothetical protein
VRDQGFAGRALTGQDVHQALGHPGFAQHVHRGQHGKRGVRRRLDDMALPVARPGATNSANISSG